MSYEQYAWAAEVETVGAVHSRAAFLTRYVPLTPVITKHKKIFVL